MARFKLGMWTRASRARMAGFEQRAKRYPTDLTDKELRFIQPFLRRCQCAGASRLPIFGQCSMRDALLPEQAAAGGCCRTTSRDCRRSTAGSGASCAGCGSARFTMSS